MPEIVARFPAAMSDPFHIELCKDSLKTVLFLLCVYGLAIGIFLSSRRNYRRGEEHGSAKWGSAKTVNKKYRAAKFEDNKIFTQNVRMGLDGRKHRRSLNTVVVGGSGAGKTRFYAKPNLCQANTSYVVLDPKGELLRDTGYLLTQKGYEVRVLDLLNMERSHCYNPFIYLRDDNDVQRLVTNLFKSTTPKGSQSNDPFWDTAASMLLLALIFYLKYEAPPEEQNFPMVMEMLRAADVREDMDEYTSPLDELFERLEMRNPDHIAVKYYKDYHSGSAKTLKSIQITLAARLEKFNLSSLAALTATDELDLPSLGEKKVALFALIPDNDTSFNFLVSILYTQLFQQLFYLADHKYGGASVIHIAAGGRDRINAMDMVEGYGDNNPIVDKAQFIMSLVEQIDPNGVGAHHKSIIDRCTDAVYREQAQTGKVPTLCTLREKLLEQPEQEAHDLALALELFTSGSLDVFAHETNVDTSSRIISYDIHDLGAQLKPAGLLTITDAMLNRVTTNWKKGKRTHLFIDEFHVVYENEYSANFFNSAWRQFRKRNTHPCAITQNVEYLLDSVQASTMLSNSEFVVMLNQAASDRAKLADLLNISTEQMSYITNADAGCGLMKYGASLVPFVNKFPKNTELYRLITTKPGEGVMGGAVNGISNN